MIEEKTQTNNQPIFSIKGQYIKDISFESPNSPQSLFAVGPAPEMKVSVDIKAQKLQAQDLQENFYESILHITVRAKTEGMTLFLADLSYAGIFQVANFPEERMEQIIMVECPFVLFPFARRVIYDMTRDGGFPPLMLEPIDFHSLYLQNKAAA